MAARLSPPSSPQLLPHDPTKLVPLFGKSVLGAAVYRQCSAALVPRLPCHLFCRHTKYVHLSRQGSARGAYFHMLQLWWHAAMLLRQSQRGGQHRRPQTGKSHTHAIFDTQRRSTHPCNHTLTNRASRSYAHTYISNVSQMMVTVRVLLLTWEKQMVASVSCALIGHARGYAPMPIGEQIAAYTLAYPLRRSPWRSSCASATHSHRAERSHVARSSCHGYLNVDMHVNGVALSVKDRERELHLDIGRHAWPSHSGSRRCHPSRGSGSSTCRGGGRREAA